MPDLSEDEQAIVELVAGFVDAEIRPVARELEHANSYPESLIDAMKQLGVYGLCIPEPWGEFRVSTSCFALVTEEIARGWMSLAGAFGGHSVVAHLLVRFGTPEQQQRWLPRMATGDVRATMALTEPDGGSDLQAIRTVARRSGDGWRVSGTKTWISNARRAGLIALLCKTDPDASPRHRGISILLVDTSGGDLAGFTVSRDLPKLGYKGVESCELHFEDCSVSGDALLGDEPGRGFGQMMAGLEIGRIQVAGRAIGVARAAFDDALRYAQERTSFGKPIWEHQSIGNYLADMATQISAASVAQLTLHAAELSDAGRSGWTWKPGWPSSSHPRRPMQIALSADPDPRRIRILHRVRRGALLPRRAR